QEYLAGHLDSADTYNRLGTTLARMGKLDDAQAAFAKAIALDPAEPLFVNSIRSVYVLREQWSEAEAVNRTLKDSSDPQRQFQASFNRAQEALYHGRLADALKQAEAAVATGAGARGAGRSFLADVLFVLGQTAAALSEAQRANAETRGATLVGLPL